MTGDPWPYRHPAVAATSAHPPTAVGSAGDECALDHRHTLPPAEASSIIARRRTELVLPRRTICCGFRPSRPVSSRSRTH
ncbi:hypothetical protein M2271_000975 [Streptomyces sp. LBL]|nr:hypothetical protein [Streptomyces sp. LBL]